LVARYGYPSVCEVQKVTRQRHQAGSAPSGKEPSHDGSGSQPQPRNSPHRSELDILSMNPRTQQ